jgi:hypothetical protein
MQTGRRASRQIIRQRGRQADRQTGAHHGQVAVLFVREGHVSRNEDVQRVRLVIMIVMVTMMEMGMTTVIVVQKWGAGGDMHSIW